jgi:prophage regulatory protein
MASLAIADARPRFLRIPDVTLETGLSRSTIYRLEQAGDFPRRVRLSGNSMGWWSTQVDEWKSDRLQQRSG